MKPAFTQLLLWIAGVYAIFFELKDLLTGGWEKFAGSWSSATSIALSLSSLLNFSLFAVGSFTAFFLFHRKNRWLSIGLLPLAIVAVILLRYCIEELIFPATLGFHNYFEGVTPEYYFFDNLYYATVFSSIGIVYYFVRYAAFRESQGQALILQAQKNELDFLRSQVNPHFLFNSLNSIYSLVYQGSEKALQAMDWLTAMLRYALYERQEKVPLSREWSYIEDFIQLQGLRFEGKIQVQAEMKADPHRILIPPFSLIPFVENAFKHGQLLDPTRPLAIVAEVGEKDFIFQVRNAVQSQGKDATGGIGLENIRKQLQLVFGDAHRLDIRQTTDQFSVVLRIPLALCR